MMPEFKDGTSAGTPSEGSRDVHSEQEDAFVQPDSGGQTDS